MELTDHCVFWIFIDAWFILNLLSTRCISESWNGFFSIVICRTNSSNHNSLCITSKWILQYTGKSGVSVWDVSAFWICKTADHMAKSWQTQINFWSFFKTVTSGSSLVLTFWTSKIDDVKFTDLDVSLSIFISFWTFNCYSKNSVGSWWVLIHISSSNMTLHCSLFKDFCHIRRCFHDEGW